MMTADEIIKKFNLVPLPEEGGYYRETFRESRKIPAEALPHHSGERSYSTCIYYLITPEEFSGLHIVASTEVFHFYAGDPVEMMQIDSEGTMNKIVLGNDFTKGHAPQVIVPPQVWQGTKLIPGGSWALLGCTVAPGFEFQDFHVEASQELIAKYPQYRDEIIAYTHS